jgi:hypothetical protein
VQVRAHAFDATHGAHRCNTILSLRLPVHVALPFLLTAGRSARIFLGRAGPGINKKNRHSAVDFGRVPSICQRGPRFLPAYLTSSAVFATLATARESRMQKHS